MATDYVKRNTASGDLATTYQLTTSTGTDATITTASINKNASATFQWATEPNIPNFLDWTAGTWTWRLRITTGAAAQLTAVTIERISSDGVTIRASKTTGTIATDISSVGVYSGTLDWSDGTQNPATRYAADRVRIKFTIKKITTAGSVYLGANLSSGNDEISSPLSVPPQQGVISETSVSVSDSIDDTEYYQKPVNEDSVTVGTDSIESTISYSKPIDDEPQVNVSADTVEATKIPAGPTGKLWDVHFVEFPEDALDSISVVKLGAKAQADKTHKYNIISKLETPAEKTHKYSIINSVSTTKTHLYNIISSVSTTKTHLYNIISTVSQTKTHKYDIIQKITQTRTHLYSLINSASTTKTHLYNVSAPMAGVSTTKTHKYNIIGLVSTTKTHRYDVAGLISTTKTHKYTILNTISTITKTHKYIILNSIQQVTKTHKYSVIAYVSVQKTHIYSIYNTVSQTKTHKYNLIQKLSTTKTHKYNLSIAVSPPTTKTHKFNLLTSAVTTKTHLYNVIGKVTHTRTHKWNAGGKVTATKTHKYEVGSGVVLAELGGSTQALIKFPERVRIVDIISKIQNLAISNVEIVQPTVPPNTAIALIELEEFRVTKTASAQRRLQLRTASQLIVPQVQERIEHKAKCDYIAIEILPLDKLSLLVQSHIGITGSKQSILIAAHTQIKQTKDTIIKVASATAIEPHAQTRIASLSNLQLPYSFTRQLIKVQEIMHKEMANLYKTIIDILKNDDLFK